MADWLSSMTHTYEYYTVDPGTWKDDKRITNVKSCTINRDSGVGTLGSATFDIAEAVGECYIRVYLVTIQNGLTEKHPLGTYLVQTPSSKFDGKMGSVTMDAYTPLLELKEKEPPIGYSLLEGDNIMQQAHLLCRENMRGPVVGTECSTPLYSDFVANTDDTWLTFLQDLVANAKYEFELDERGRVLFSPIRNMASLQPVWTFNDDNSSILYSDISLNRDLYGIPNVVEVIYSDGKDSYYAKVVNDDPNSPTSTVKRGRIIPHRDNNPSISGVPTQPMIDEYATRVLRELSTVEYTVSYTHGYCPVRVGDCVRLNYTRADMTNIKAKVISQSIKCDTECQVTERAVFTKKLWG